MLKTGTFWVFFFPALKPLTVLFPALKPLTVLINDWDKYLFIYQIFQPWVRCDTKLIFKWSTASLNSEFSFSKTDCLNKAKEPSSYLPNPYTTSRMWYKNQFLKGIQLVQNQSFIKAKEPSLPYIWPIAGKRRDRFMSFSRGISIKAKVNSLV